MKRKRVITLLLILSSVGLTLFWLKPRSMHCQRCGAHLSVCGPFVVGLASNYLGGAGGDKGLYCDRNGHVLVREYDHSVKITDWMHHPDSYRDEGHDGTSSVELMMSL